MWNFFKTAADRVGQLLRRKVPGDIPLSAIAPFLPAAPVILEAGAHRGVDTLRFLRYWPKCVVHAFEPVPDVFAALTQAVGVEPRVRLYPLALSNQSGQATIHISEGGSDGSSSLLRPSGHLALHPDVVFTRELTVATVTLDEWAVTTGVPRVDFLWLDLQGNELQVLKSGPHVLQTVSAIHAEVSRKSMYEGDALYAELREWLEEKGFGVACEELPWEVGGNVLFTRSKT